MTFTSVNADGTLGATSGGFMSQYVGPAPGTINPDYTIESFVIGGALFKGAGTAIGSIRIPVYRVFGDGSRVFGRSWTPFINPTLYGKYYRNFAGLPNLNSGAFMVKGSVQLKDIFRFRMALPYSGNFGRLVPEVLINNASSSVRLSTFRVLTP